MRIISTLLAAIALASLVGAIAKQRTIEAMAKQRTSSTVVRFGDITYYIHQIPELGVSIEDFQTDEPCTVFEIGTVKLTSEVLHETIGRFEVSDDVWSKDFLSGVVLQFRGAELSIQPETARILKQWGNQKLYSIQVPENGASYPEGPYFLNARKLHAAYRLYPDTAGAFIVATVQTDDPFQCKSLDAAAYGETYPSTLTIAVPSRLYSRKTKEKPYADMRLGVKDIIDLRGLRTGASSRAYTQQYGPRDENVVILQKLLNLGFIVVGKLKTTQFADSEWPTCDWVDYHELFNPRADRYQSPSGSSAGSTAAIATYEWLDFSIGTDTLGSIRAPAIAQGIFGMRPSIGSASFTGIIPYSYLPNLNMLPRILLISLVNLTLLAGFSRDVESLALLSRALYGSVEVPECIKKPTTILYPEEYWPVPHKESQGVFEKFITKLESFLDVKRTRIRLEKIWQSTKHVDTDLSLEAYFEHVFEWVANLDQWNEFLKKFLEDYLSTYGKIPVVNPQLQFERDYLPTQTEEELVEGIQLLKNFQTWYETNIIPPAVDGCSKTILVTPWSKGEPDYRDKYRQSAQKFTGIGFFFYNLSPYAGAPELIIPAGQTSYISRLTHQKEWPPATIGVIGAKGSDTMLVDLIKDFMGNDTGMEAGRVAFNVISDSILNHDSELEQKILRG